MLKQPVDIKLFPPPMHILSDSLVAVLYKVLLGQYSIVFQNEKYISLEIVSGNATGNIDTN